MMMLNFNNNGKRKHLQFLSSNKGNVVILEIKLWKLNWWSLILNNFLFCFLGDPRASKGTVPRGGRPGSGGHRLVAVGVVKRFPLGERWREPEESHQILPNRVPTLLRRSPIRTSTGSFIIRYYTYSRLFFHRSSLNSRQCKLKKCSKLKSFSWKAGFFF